jgi:hypothetical protein
VAKLIYTDGGTNQDFALDPGRAAYTVGRNPMCDLRINNPSISRKHAEIRLDAGTGRYSVYDLNSSNGTYLNGKREQQAELKSGDEVMCGEFKLFFHTDDSAVAAELTEAGTPVSPPSPPLPPPPPPPPGPPKYSKTLAAKPGDLFSNSGEMESIADLKAATNSASTMRVSAEIFNDSFPSESPEVPQIADKAPEQPQQLEQPDASPAADVHVAETARELKAAKAELKSLRMALQNESGRAAEASQEKAKLSKEIQRLKDDFAAGQGIGSDLQNASSRVEELEAQLSKRDARIAALESDEGAGITELEKLRADLVVAKKHALAAKADASKAAGNRDKARAEAAKVAGDRDKARAEAAKSAGDPDTKRLKADLRRRGDDLDSAKAETAKKDVRIKALEAEAKKLRTAEGELEIARSQIEELQATSAGAVPDRDALKAKNTAMKAAFKDLSSELQDLVQSNRDLAKQLASIKDV